MTAHEAGNKKRLNDFCNLKIQQQNEHSSNHTNIKVQAHNAVCITQKNRTEQNETTKLIIRFFFFGSGKLLMLLYIKKEAEDNKKFAFKLKQLKPKWMLICVI